VDNIYEMPLLNTNHHERNMKIKWEEQEKTVVCFAIDSVNTQGLGSCAKKSTETER
jgi:hypothetical protein